MPIISFRNTRLLRRRRTWSRLRARCQVPLVTTYLLVKSTEIMLNLILSRHCCECMDCLWLMLEGSSMRRRS